MASESEKGGVKPSPRNPQQTPPGVEDRMRPQADHGEQSYRGAGKLDGLAAIITGGDSGIGRAVAIAFAREGADVAIGYGMPEEEKDALETQSWVEEAGRRCVAHQFDVRDPAACRAFVQAVHKAFGRLDILVNNAAEQHETEDVSKIEAEQIERTFRTNIYSFFFMAKHAVPHMKKGSTIINTTSITAFKGHKTLLDYSATKGAIVAFTRSLAEALMEKGIRVNAVAPGPIWTPLIPASFSAEHTAKHGSASQMQRAGQPNEVAPSYVFLASAESSYFSGQILHPNGGSPVA
jgi:NAD(P)-dependent dehydrogenase (short-subunit alcohol dehydrogenase family)